MVPRRTTQVATWCSLGQLLGLRQCKKMRLLFRRYLRTLPAQRTVSITLTAMPPHQQHLLSLTHLLVSHRRHLRIWCVRLPSPITGVANPLILIINVDHAQTGVSQRGQLLTCKYTCQALLAMALGGAPQLHGCVCLAYDMYDAVAPPPALAGKIVSSGLMDL